MADPLAIQQLYSFLDSWLRFVALTAICLVPPLIVGVCIITGALMVRARDDSEVD